MAHLFGFYIDRQIVAWGIPGIPSRNSGDIHDKYSQGENGDFPPPPVFASPGGYLNSHLSHSIFLITIWPTFKKWPDIHLLSEGFVKIPIFTTLFAPFTED